MANSIILGKVKGETGATGPQGATGEAGANGITPDIRNGTWWLGQTDTGVTAKGNEWFTGVDNPTIQGINGDLYLNTQTGDVFKKENNVWNLVINIKGEKGEQGEQGERGESALTFRVGDVTTLAPNETAKVRNVGTDTDIVLDFEIPQGEQGEAGRGAGTKVFVGGFEQNIISFEADPQSQINELKQNAGTGGAEYTEGDGIDITDNVISVKQELLATINDTKAGLDDAQDELNKKLDEDNITNTLIDIELEGKIPTDSAVVEYVDNAIENIPTGADYTAGTGISITDNTISVADNVMMTNKANVITGGSQKVASSSTSSTYTEIGRGNITLKNGSNWYEYLGVYSYGIYFPKEYATIGVEFNDPYSYGLYLKNTNNAFISGKTSQYIYSFKTLIPAEPSSKIAKRMTDQNYKPLESIVILCNNEDVENDYKLGHLYRIDVDKSATPYTHTITDITPVSSGNSSGKQQFTFTDYQDMCDKLQEFVGMEHKVKLIVANTSYTTGRYIQAGYDITGDAQMVAFNTPETTTSSVKAVGYYQMIPDTSHLSYAFQKSEGYMTASPYNYGTELHTIFIKATGTYVKKDINMVTEGDTRTIKNYTEFHQVYNHTQYVTQYTLEVDE